LVKLRNGTILIFPSEFWLSFSTGELWAPLKTRHFGEGKEAARGKPECMGEYMRM